MRYWVQVSGPRLNSGPFGTGESLVVSDPDQHVTVLEDGTLRVAECERLTHFGGQERVRPARVTTYADGQWTKFAVGIVREVVR